MAWKTCLKELLWFIRGQTDNKLLKELGVHIWDGNATREFLDDRRFNDYNVEDLGLFMVINGETLINHMVKKKLQKKVLFNFNKLLMLLKIQNNVQVDVLL